jgi:hypothetical protein
VYRKDANFAVWDSRGLTVRKGSGKKTSRLPDISLTPKLFGKDQIIANRKLIKDGTRSRGADALSGSRRIGDSVYFLLRWDDSSGVAWMEALVVVDLSNAELQPKLVGKFDGLTTSSKKIDELLFSDPGFLRTMTRKPDQSWGVASYEIGSGKFSFKDIGQNLLFSWRLSPQTALVEQRTSYGTKTVSRLDIVNGANRTLREFRGSASLVSPEQPFVLRLESPSGTVLQDLDSAAEIRVTTDEEAKSAGANIVIWPKGTPAKAALYDPTRWQLLARTVGPENSLAPVGRSLHSRNRRARPSRP